MRLYLVRHGDAVSEQVDSTRPLSKVGKEEVFKVAQFFAKKKEVPVNIIWHSSKKRAEQTAEVFKKIFCPQADLAQREGLGPNDSMDKIYFEIQNCKEGLMIVGHLPSISRLTSKLVNGHEEREIVAFHTATLAALERDEKQTWRVLYSISPDQIPS